jgi:hypothetical protein
VIAGDATMRAPNRAARWRMKLSKAVSEFVADLRVSGKAAMTVTAYESDLTRLVALAVPNSVLAFTPDLVRLYFQTASAQGLKMSTLHRKRAALSEGQVPTLLDNRDGDARGVELNGAIRGIPR